MSPVPRSAASLTEQIIVERLLCAGTEHKVGAACVLMELTLRCGRQTVYTGEKWFVRPSVLRGKCSEEGGGGAEEWGLHEASTVPGKMRWTGQRGALGPLLSGHESHPWRLCPHDLITA